MENLVINGITKQYNKVWYVNSVSGDDALGDGTIGNPMMTMDAVYALMADGDAVYMQGVPNPTSNYYTFNVYWNKNTDFYGDGASTQFGSGNSSHSCRNVVTWNFYRVVMRVLELGRSSPSGAEFHIYNSVVQNGHGLLGYPNSTHQSSTMSMCVILQGNVGYGSLRNANTISDSVIIGAAGGSSYGGLVVNNCWHNDVYIPYSNSVALTNDSEVANYGVDSDYRLESGFNGGDTDVGVYVGDYGWDGATDIDIGYIKLQILAADTSRIYNQMNYIQVVTKEGLDLPISLLEVNHDPSSGGSPANIINHRNTANSTTYSWSFPSSTLSTAIANNGAVEAIYRFKSAIGRPAKGDLRVLNGNVFKHVKLLGSLNKDTGYVELMDIYGDPGFASDLYENVAFTTLFPILDPYLLIHPDGSAWRYDSVDKFVQATTGQTAPNAADFAGFGMRKVPYIPMSELLAWSPTGQFTVELNSTEYQPGETHALATSHIVDQQIALAKTSTDLTNVHRLEQIVPVFANGDDSIRLVASTDGASWSAWDGNTWYDLGALTSDNASADIVGAFGMSPETLMSLTWTQWETFFGTEKPTQIRLGYAFNGAVVGGGANLDRLDVYVVHAGEWVEDFSNTRVELEPSGVRVTPLTDFVTMRVIYQD